MFNENNRFDYKFALKTTILHCKRLLCIGGVIYIIFILCIDGKDDGKKKPMFKQTVKYSEIN